MCDLPVNPVTPQSSWTHISDIDLADPDFGRPGRIDLLLGVDIFVGSLFHGRRVGIPGSPSAFETKFGWVLAGSVDSQGHPHQVATHHSTIIVGDDLLRKFWEIEEDRDLHQFVWRQTRDQPIQDFRMTRITFGVSASSFFANMCVKQNALGFSLQYPQAVSAVENFSILMMASQELTQSKRPFYYTSNSRSSSLKEDSCCESGIPVKLQC